MTESPAPSGGRRRLPRPHAGFWSHAVVGVLCLYLGGLLVAHYHHCLTSMSQEILNHGVKVGARKLLWWAYRTLRSNRLKQRRGDRMNGGRLH